MFVIPVWKKPVIRKNNGKNVVAKSDIVLYIILLSVLTRKVLLVVLLSGRGFGFPISVLKLLSLNFYATFPLYPDTRFPLD